MIFFFVRLKYRNTFIHHLFRENREFFIFCTFFCTNFHEISFIFIQIYFFFYYSSNPYTACTWIIHTFVSSFRHVRPLAPTFVYGFNVLFSVELNFMRLATRFREPLKSGTCWIIVSHPSWLYFLRTYVMIYTSIVHAYILCLAGVHNFRTALNLYIRRME